MSAKILLINPARHFIANQVGLGYLTPLGLVLIGGPLIDAGHTVKLIDHDMNGWSFQKLINEIKNFSPNYILLGHSGSTASHNIVIQTVKEIRKNYSTAKIIYGGVYPSYAYQNILDEVPEIDVIVRGEGEKTLLDLISAWEQHPDMSQVRGVVWRKDGEIVVNHPQPAIQNLDVSPGLGIIGMGKVSNVRLRPCRRSTIFSWMHTYLCILWSMDVLEKVAASQYRRFSESNESFGKRLRRKNYLVCG
ncbi:MAG: cobalamin-dependent protein [Anaerolineales bacterium]|nr:cobalamin-dependent protein [Anaerolineales bacterium]